MTDNEYWTCYQCGETYGPRLLTPAPPPNRADPDPHELADWITRARERNRTAALAQRALVGIDMTPDDITELRTRIHQLHTNPDTDQPNADQANDQ
jgi:hypothetical protein